MWKKRVDFRLLKVWLSSLITPSGPCLNSWVREVYRITWPLPICCPICISHGFIHVPERTHTLLARRCTTELTNTKLSRLFMDPPLTVHLEDASRSISFRKFLGTFSTLPTQRKQFWHSTETLKQVGNGISNSKQSNSADYSGIFFLLGSPLLVTCICAGIQHPGGEETLRWRGFWKRTVGKAIH